MNYLILAGEQAVFTSFPDESAESISGQIYIENRRKGF
jgi:hypothetical protein